MYKAIKDHFHNVSENDDSILAATVLPKFKLKWVESQRKKDDYKQMLLQAMKQYTDDQAMSTTGSQEESQKASKKKDDFYEFKYDDEGSSQNSCTEERGNRMPKELSAFSHKQFHMYNTVLP